MGIYERSGLRKLGLNVVEWLNWIRIYKLKTGTKIFGNLLKRKNGYFQVNASMFEAPVYLRDNASDVFIFKQVFYEKQYDLYDREMPAALAIIDAGANIGMASVYFSLKFPHAKVVAIEPEKCNFEVLVKNTSHYKNIKPMNNALWDKNELLHISNPSSLAAGFIVEGTKEEKSEVLQGVTLGKIMEENHWEGIDILKMDIEGAEREVFSADDLEWLKKVKLLIVETHDRFKPGTTKALFKAIEPYDYTAYFHHENIFIFFNPQK